MLDSAVCPLLAADRPQSSPGFREASVTIQYKLEKTWKAATYYSFHLSVRYSEKGSFNLLKCSLNLELSTTHKLSPLSK